MHVPQNKLTCDVFYFLLIIVGYLKYFNKLFIYFSDFLFLPFTDVSESLIFKGTRRYYK